MDPDDLFNSLEQDETPAADPIGQLEGQKLTAAQEYANNLLAGLGMDEDTAVPAKRPHFDAGLEPEEGQIHRNYDQNIHVHTIETDTENCVHEVALPPNIDFEPLRTMSVEPAHTYPFQLDSFQKESIQCIENSQSVLVSAHTSAGKTVVALYAIAQSLRDKQRVIYTSPIKALSNQKYRELEEQFQDVGLMTGDVTLNPDASCLVMTTEILRSMLYRGSQIMREVGWVVFDEIHYMRDKERGVVWEETIILMPPTCHAVFLSATIPNARQFAEWVCWLKRKPCHVVYTDYRPTPLQHFIFPAGASGLYEAVDIKGNFREDKFAEAMSFLKSDGDAKHGIQRGRKGGAKAASESNVNKIIRTMKENDMVPCIIFSFSRKECEGYALALKDMDFNTAREKQQIREIFQNAIDILNDEDKKLPQISQILPLLSRGIGVHHSGLLPVLKELVEILFGEGLLKTLFATETFSMGLNMPARTVVFTSARKFDGKDFRWITSGEYIQMSGRAGRRGLDTRGLVIMMVDEQMSPSDARQIIKGTTDPLNSQFRLTYNMVLNMLRVEGATPEYMLEHSFYQFQNNAAIPVLQTKLAALETELDSIQITKEVALDGYYELEKSIVTAKEQIRATVMSPKNLVPFLHAGRLFHIKKANLDFGWGPLINFHRKVNPDNKSEVVFALEVLLPLAPDSVGDLKNIAQLRPATSLDRASWEVVPLAIDTVYDVSAVRIQLPKSLKHEKERAVVETILKEVKKRFKDTYPPLDPITDMKINDERFKKMYEAQKKNEARYLEHELRGRKDFEQLCEQWKRKDMKRQEVQQLNKDLSKAMSLLQQDELKKRKRVLRRLEYCDQGDIVTEKGKAACEISASDELLLVEMLFAGVFAKLSPTEIAALLSCFVFQDKAPPGKMAENLSGCLRQIQEHARRIAKITIDCKMELDEEQYVDSFKPGLMEVVSEWADGKSFADITKNRDLFEGSIIRTLRRLEEVLREMMSAAKNIGNAELEERFSAAKTMVKRDIVFAASLYL